MPRPSKPLHQQVIEELRERLKAGQYRPGDKLPIEADLAQQFGLSRGTIRQALQTLVSEGLIERIPGKGSFLKGPFPAVLAGHPPSRLIGMVVPSLRDLLSTDMINGAERSLRAHGYSLVFCHSDHELEVEKLQIQQLLNQQVAGIILFPLGHPDEAGLVSAVRESGCALVTIDRRIMGIETPIVQADNFGGGYAAVQHLLELGHRRIACISNSSDISSVSERVSGYEQAMRDAQLLPYAAIPLMGPSTLLADASPLDIGPEEIRLVEHMLTVKERPTAVFCINDFAAIGVMRHFIAHGLRIPEDIAVVGFDNSPFAPFAPVPLTSVAQPAVEIGATAAETILIIIRGEALPQPAIKLQTRLVVRESTLRKQTIPLSALGTL